MGQRFPAWFEDQEFYEGTKDESIKLPRKSFEEKILQLK